MIQEVPFETCAAFVIFIVSLLFLFPVLFLLFVQLKNLAIDKTTAERFSQFRQLDEREKPIKDEKMSVQDDTEEL